MRIAYISFSLSNPRDQITLRGLRENGAMVTEISDKTQGIKKYISFAKKYWAIRKECDVIMIGYASSVLVIFIRLISRKPIIYNALATFYDSMIVSRLHGSFFSITAIWHYLIDFFAFRLASQSFLECQAQIDLVAKVFKLNPKHISVQFVGTDDAQFYFDPAVQKLSTFTVMFRGAFLPEAGVDTVIRAAKELEPQYINVRILGRGMLIKEMESLVKELQPKNLEMITELLPFDTLRTKMLECHISLGQLANHPRVHTTIPHKVFESMAMKLPYVTGANKGVLEVVEDGKTCFCVPPGDHKALAKKILELRDKQAELERVAQHAYDLYQKEYTPKILGRKVLAQIASR